MNNNYESSYNNEDNKTLFEEINLNIFINLSFLHQRLYFLNIELYEPNSLGKSRQGQPVLIL